MLENLTLDEKAPYNSLSSSNFTTSHNRQAHPYTTMVRSIVPTQWSSDSNSNRQRCVSAPRKYVDFGNPKESQAAVEKWIKHPDGQSLSSSSRSRSSRLQRLQVDCGSPERHHPELHEYGSGQSRSLSRKKLRERLRNRVKCREDKIERHSKEGQQRYDNSEMSTTSPKRVTPTAEQRRSPALERSRERKSRRDSPRVSPISTDISKISFGSSAKHPGLQDRRKFFNEYHDQVPPVVSNDSLNDSRRSHRLIPELSLDTDTSAVSTSPRHSVEGSRSRRDLSHSSSRSSVRRKDRRQAITIDHSKSGSSSSSQSMKRMSPRSLLPVRQASDEEREKQARTRKRVSHQDRRQPTAPATKIIRLKIHVYDLIAQNVVMPLFGCHFPIGQCFNAVNNGLNTLGTGAYHVGVEVS